MRAACHMWRARVAGGRTKLVRQSCHAVSGVTVVSYHRPRIGIAAPTGLSAPRRRSLPGSPLLTGVDGEAPPIALSPGEARKTLREPLPWPREDVQALHSREGESTRRRPSLPARYSRRRCRPCSAPMPSGPAATRGLPLRACLRAEGRGSQLPRARSDRRGVNGGVNRNRSTAGRFLESWPRTPAETGWVGP